MIDLQSLASVEGLNYRPCCSPSPWGEGRGEGGLFVLASCSGSGAGELNIVDVSPRLCAFASSLLKFGKKEPQILNPLQSIPSLSKPFQGTGEGRGAGSKNLRICPPFEPIIAYLHLIAPICGFFPKKKIVYFPAAKATRIVLTSIASQPKSTTAPRLTGQKQTVWTGKLNKNIAGQRRRSTKTWRLPMNGFRNNKNDEILKRVGDNR